MMYTPVALATVAASINWAERGSTAGTVALMGMVTIFAVLAILWAMIEIMHALLHKGEKKVKEPKPQKTAPKPAPQSAANPNDSASPNDAAIAAAIAASLAASEDNGAIVAAITAAITAARAEAGENGSFRVVSFKRVDRKRGYRR